jgi:hypothetical protein
VVWIKGSSLLEKEAKALELPTTAYEIRNEGYEFSDKRDIRFSVEREIHVEPGDIAWDSLELHRGGPVPEEVKHRLYRKVIINKCAKKYGWPAIQVGLDAFLIVTGTAKAIIEKLGQHRQHARASVFASLQEQSARGDRQSFEDRLRPPRPPCIC